MSLLSFFGYKDEPEIEEAKKQCDNLMKTANDQVKERQKQQQHLRRHRQQYNQHQQEEAVVERPRESLLLKSVLQNLCIVK